MFPPTVFNYFAHPVNDLRRLQTRILFACIKTIRLFFSRAYPNTQNKLNELCLFTETSFVN